MIPPFLIVAASSWGSRIVVASSQLILIRDLLQRLGAQQYSVFALLGGLIAWSALADFGVGASVQNYISERRTLNKNYAELIVTSTLLILPIFLILCGLLYLFSPFLAGFYLKNAVFLSANDKTELFATTVLIFFITTLGGITYKCWYANQLGWLANVFPAVGTLIGLALILTVNINAYAYPILAVIILYYSPAAIFSIFALISNFYYHQIKINILSFLNNSKIILLRGSAFWLFAIISTIALQADYLVLSQHIAADEIVLYTTLLKIFSLGFFIYLALLQALWPVCIELRVQQNWSELKKVVHRYILIGVIGIFIFTLLFILFRNDIINIMSLHIAIPISTALLFGTLFIIKVWTDTFSILLQSLNKLKPLWFIVPIQALLSFKLQWFLGGSYGVNGMLLGAMLSLLLTMVIGGPFFFYRTLRTHAK